MIRLVFNIIILLCGLVFDIIKMTGVGNYQSWKPLDLWSFFLVNVFLIMCGIAKGKEYEKQELNDWIKISRRLILLCGIVFGICAVSLLVMTLLSVA